MEVESNKGICPEFVRSVFDACKDDHDELPLVDLSMNLFPCQIQEMPCLSLGILRLEFITRLVESACTTLLLPNLGSLL